jgi:transposase
VDGLHSENYKVHLANTTYIQQYSGLKYTDDKHDAIWLAHLLRLGLLAEGYIYPKEQRGLRELLRRRQLMVREQTRHLLGGTTKIKTLSLTDKTKLASYAKDKNIQLAIKGQAAVLETVLKQIKTLEIELKDQLHGNDSYKLLLSIPGVGKILAWLIVLETGNIRRFQQVGNYSSYCRCAESKRISNAKKKGENNRKNGSAYLGWAFIEASITAIQHYPEIKRYYQRELNKSLRVVALKAVANKLARATYFILRDGVAFDMKKSFK